MASCQNQPSMASLRQSFLQWHSSLKEGHWVDSLCVAQKCCFIPPPDCSISSANTRWIQYLYYHVRGRETMPGISWEVPDWTPEGTPGLHRGPVEHSWGRSLSQLLRTEHLCVFPPPKFIYWTPNPQCDDVGGGAFGRWLSHEDRALRNGISRNRVETETRDTALSAMWGHRRQPSKAKHGICWHLGLGPSSLQNSET